MFIVKSGRLLEISVKYRFIEFFVFDYDFLIYFLRFSGQGLLFL